MRFGDDDVGGNVEDRRGQSFGAPALIGGGGVGALLIAAVVFLLGGDPSAILNGAGSSGVNAPPAGAPPGQRADDKDAEFARLVLGSTDRIWTAVFDQQGGRYEKPTLVLYDNVTPTACGTGQSAMGPFYCPADRRLYIDLAFNKELAGKFGAGGDFAQAYVIAHEVGHHVQNLTGVSEQVQQAQQAAGSRAGANQLSVRLELQADCYAGVWARGAGDQLGQLEAGDIQEGLRAASAVGDDRLQQQAQGRIVPESFTHGSAAQRSQWFTVGYESGDFQRCDTFQGL